MSGVNLGAEISGVDLRQPLLDAQFEAIEQALVENELIIFRDQDITSDQLMAFGRRFNDLTVHPFAPNEGKNAPELIKFRNDETTPPFGTDVWHSDETFRAEPPMATILVAKEVPAVGGDTMFASMTAAYEGLSDRMQQYISGLYAIHDMKPFRPLFGKSLEDRKKLQEFELKYPPQLHPVVRIHPVSGKKSLFVNPQFTLAIDGMEENESRALLDDAVRAGAGAGISVPPSLAAAHHRDVGQPLDPALRGARLLSAAPLHGARHHQGRAGDRAGARRSRRHQAREICGAEGRRYSWRPQAALIRLRAGIVGWAKRSEPTISWNENASGGLASLSPPTIARQAPAAAI